MNPEVILSEFARFGSKLGLERMFSLCEMMGDPQDKLRVIHVAGTNGKGSVCRFIYETLLAHGLSCGLYISPYITSFNERIQLDGAYISDDELELHLGRAASAAQGMGDTPTEFEVVTAAAFSYFAEKAPDFVILEVGLGGDGDSTNVIKAPLVSVISSISYDHMDRLGDSLEQIAASKAGIIKHGCPVISAARDAAAKVIAARAYELSAPLVDAVRIIDKTRHSLEYTDEDLDMADHYSQPNQVLSASIQGRHYDGIRISALGRHQIENAICALCVLESLRERKLITLDGEALRAGMLRAHMPGRFEIICADPLVILDGAHNEAGAEALASAVHELLEGKRILAVVGALEDKDAGAIVAHVAGFASKMIFTSAPGERGQSGMDLLAQVTNQGVLDIPLIAMDGPEDAVHLGICELKEDKFDALIVCGSLYLISSIRPLFMENN